MTKVIAVLNMKGGVGKTTISFNLGAELIKMNKKVLMVDFDPQSSLSQFVLGEDKAIELYNTSSKNIFTYFENYPNESIHGLIYEENSYHIIPSTLRLAKALSYPSDTIILGFNKLIKELKSSDKNYDYIIIDCPPFESVLSRATYHASDFILNPVTISKFSILGINLLKESMSEYCSLYNSDLKGATVINGYKDNSSVNYVSLVSAVKLGVSELKKLPFLSWDMIQTNILQSDTHLTSQLKGTCLRDTTYCRLGIIQNFTDFVNELILKI